MKAAALVEHHPLIKLIQKEQRLIIGLMSGTSLDGVDAAIISIEGNGFQTRWKLIAFDIFSYPQEIQSELFRLVSDKEWDAEHFCRIHVWLGHFFAQVSQRICKSAGLSLSQIDLIGSHGQTVRHLPERVSMAGFDVAATLQIGEPAAIAKLTGCPTVGDFRPADVALGGQGAPLVPLVDYVLFRSQDQSRGILNIGGISNVTVIPRDAAVDEVFAFDTGPGNMILDLLAQKLFNCAMDTDGAIAAQGQPSPSLLDELLRHPYFKLPPPKSTGRELFGDDYLDHLIASGRSRHLSDSELLATATAFIAASIAAAYEMHIRPGAQLDEIYVGGGGVNNPVLFRALQHSLNPVRVQKTDTAGIPADAKEAICFAILANETLFGNPGNLPRVTGASRQTVLGKICL